MKFAVMLQKVWVSSPASFTEYLTRTGDVVEASRRTELRCNLYALRLLAEQPGEHQLKVKQGLG